MTENRRGYPPEYGLWSAEATAADAWETRRELHGEPPAGDPAATIKVEGRTYRVEIRDDTGDRPAGKPEGPVYWLHGARGAVYYTMRNVHHPEMMFLVNGAGFTRGAPRAWLTDKTGELKPR